MVTKLNSIFRHPVKGLSAEPLKSVRLTAGRALPNDRRFALALFSKAKEVAPETWLPKSNYLMLQKNERLAQLETHFEDDKDMLYISRRGNQVASGNLSDRIGRTTIENFFSAFFKNDIQSRPKLVEAVGAHTLSDHKSPVISILNLASVKDLERIIQQTVDPMRFRANLWLEGVPPWVEFDWINKQLKIGSVSLTVIERIDRCAAINVNPKTAERDQNIIKALQSGCSHTDFGVYGHVDSHGTIAVGDTIIVPV